RRRMGRRSRSRRTKKTPLASPPHRKQTVFSVQDRTTPGWNAWWPRRWRLAEPRTAAPDQMGGRPSRLVHRNRGFGKTDLLSGRPECDLGLRDALNPPACKDRKTKWMDEESRKAGIKAGKGSESPPPDFLVSLSI